METPIRDQIRLDNLWQAQRISPQSSRVFIPAPWEGSEIRLIPLTGVPLSARPLSFTFGTWNQLQGDISLDGARLVASPPFYVKRVEWRHTANGLLTVQTELQCTQACSLHLTLSAPNGHQVASAHQPVRERVDHVRTDLELPVPLAAGSYRLKVVMVVGDQIMDNARTEVFLSE